MWTWLFLYRSHCSSEEWTEAHTVGKKLFLPFVAILDFHITWPFNIPQFAAYKKSSLMTIVV